MDSPDPATQISSLDKEHEQIFQTALSSILNTRVAELTFAQLLDGLPTEQSFRDSYVWMKSHPVYKLPHTEICDGFVEKAREFRSQFDPSQLRFQPSLLEAFSRTPLHSRAFHLRLIELIVVACHQIAAYLYELDDGAHKHQIHQEWLQAELDADQKGTQRRYYHLPPSAFFHCSYQYPEQYPRGLADVAGYWAEGKIFGGVIVFDRGETEDQCNSMWIHGALIEGPRTLYPPTTQQFDALVRFLLDDRDNGVPCPLPIHGTTENRPRWHPYYAMAEYHIFRDKFERKLTPPDPRENHRLTPMDWPEITDEFVLINEIHARFRGEPFDEDVMAAAQARLQIITPSSPLFRRLFTSPGSWRPLD